MTTIAEARAMGWGPGTRLVGDEGYGPTVIEITAIGRDYVLARRISHKGEPCPDRENNWTLECRDWREVETDQPRMHPAEALVAAAKASTRKLIADAIERAGAIHDMRELRDAYAHAARIARGETDT